MSKLVIVTFELAEAKALVRELQRVPLSKDQVAFGFGLLKLERGIEKCNSGRTKVRHVDAYDDPRSTDKETSR